MSDSSITPQRKYGYTKIDISGQRFGRWTVIKDAPSRGGIAYCLCQCDCGTMREVQVGNLKNGSSKSCGCLCAEIVSAIKTKHGMHKDPVYNIWLCMKDRCSNPNSPSYNKYGGRGISVCNRWQHSFEAFFSDMGPRPKETSLDRIDNNGPYSPENCRWATQEQQMNNKRTNHFLEWNGVKHTLAQWSRILGIQHSTLLVRLDCLHWPIDKAFTVPVRKWLRTNLHLTCGKETHTLTEWAIISGINRPTLHMRVVLLGWTIQRALTTPVRKRVPCSRK